jgi:hypothetical protein
MVTATASPDHHVVEALRDRHPMAASGAVAQGFL